MRRDIQAIWKVTKNTPTAATDPGHRCATTIRRQPAGLVRLTHENQKPDTESAGVCTSPGTHASTVQSAPRKRHPVPPRPSGVFWSACEGSPSAAGALFTRYSSWLDRILRRRIGGRDRPRTGSEALPLALEFAASVLTAGRSSRPTTARALADALRGMPRSRSSRR